MDRNRNPKIYNILFLASVVKYPIYVDTNLYYLGPPSLGKLVELALRCNACHMANPMRIQRGRQIN